MGRATMLSLQVPARALLTILLTILFSITNASLINDIATSLVQMDDCDSCRDLLGSFQTIAFTGDDAFVSTFVSLCVGLEVNCTVFFPFSYFLTRLI